MQASRLQTGPVSGLGDKWPAMQARPRVHQFRSILGITTPSFEKATIMTEPAPRPVPPRHPARAALPPGIDAADLRRLAAALAAAADVVRRLPRGAGDGPAGVRSAWPDMIRAALFGAGHAGDNTLQARSGRYRRDGADDRPAMGGECTPAPIAMGAGLRCALGGIAGQVPAQPHNPEPRLSRGAGHTGAGRAQGECRSDETAIAGPHSTPGQKRQDSRRATGGGKFQLDIWYKIGYFLLYAAGRWVAAIPDWIRPDCIGYPIAPDLARQVQQPAPTFGIAIFYYDLSS